jgi:membrane protease YdiL (CAAX protease family)
MARAQPVVMSTPPPPFGSSAPQKPGWPFKPIDLMNRVVPEGRAAIGGLAIWFFIWPFVILLSGDIAGLLTLAIGEVSAALGEDDISEQSYLRSLYLLLVVTDLALLWIFAGWLQRRGLTAAVLDVRPGRFGLETGYAGVFLILTVVFAVAATDWLTTYTPLPDMTNELPVPGDDPSAIWYMIPAIVLLGPYIEEVVFRGWLLPALVKRMGGWVLPILISSLMFGALHVFVGVPVVIYTAVLGICAGLARRVTGRLWAPVLIHVANNLIATVEM